MNFATLHQILCEQRCWAGVKKAVKYVIQQSPTTDITKRNVCDRAGSIMEIEEGGMVAYVIMGDSKDMNATMNDHRYGGLLHFKAVARIAIRRFAAKGSWMNYMFRQETRVYRVAGLDADKEFGFSEAVKAALRASNKTTMGDETEFEKRGYTDELSDTHSTEDEFEGVPMNELTSKQARFYIQQKMKEAPGSHVDIIVGDMMKNGLKIDDDMMRA